MRSPVIYSLVLAMVAMVQGANWPHFRGPQFNGSSDERNLPVQWSQTENVRWSVDLPGASAATPIIWGDSVFVSSSNAENAGMVAMSFNRKTGKLLWKHEQSGPINQDERSNYASPTPVTDGEVVIFFYGNGDLLAFDFNGELQWKRNMQKDFGPFAFGWTFSASPLLFDGTLFMQVLQRDVPVRGRGFSDRKNESYIAALDPKTGKTIWRHIRPSQAVAESRESFATPVPFQYKGRKELLVVGGDDVTGHDPKTGRELWRWGTWNPSRIGHWRHVPSPVASEDVISVCAPKRDPIYAIKAGGKGLLNDNSIAWTSKDERPVTTDVPTPAFYQGDFFVLSDVRKSLSRVDPKSGKVKWTIRTPGSPKFEASPTAADGKIYMVNFSAEVVVVDASDGAILNVIKMDDPQDDPVRSGISVAQGNLFIRTTRKLFCIGK